MIVITFLLFTLIIAQLFTASLQGLIIQVLLFNEMKIRMVIKSLLKQATVVSSLVKSLRLPTCEKRNVKSVLQLRCKYIGKILRASC